jgi:histidinol-phosphate aminotransferase
MRTSRLQNLIRANVRQVVPYLPGEQPKIKGLIKLNTNENPYPPTPRVLAAMRAAVDGRLRLYPNATAQPLRERLARLHRCQPDNIIIGNGSDELLAMAVRAFVDPAGNEARFKPRRSPEPLVQYFTPSYSLYPVLADIHGATKNPVPMNPDFSLPTIDELRRGKHWNHRAALTFITTPNAPGGRSYSTPLLERICRAQQGVVILDEAYVDFAPDNAMRLALKYPHVIVARTFSKSYSLCFQRIGYFVGHAELIAALHGIRDSYNVNGLGQVAALATLDDLPRYRQRIRRIVATRERLAKRLAALGFHVFPSQTNFLLVKPPRFSAGEWQSKLRTRKILVRWFKDPAVVEFLRITVGTNAEANALLKEAKRILG